MKWFGSSERNPIMPGYAKHLRGVLAFLIAPLVPALLGSALMAFARGDPGIIFSSGTLWAAKIAVIFGYPVMAVIGLPSYLVLKAYKRKSLWSFILAGAVCGTVMYLIFIILPHASGGAVAMSRRAAETISLAGLAFCVGALSGSSFWLVARPDRVGA